jgi:hypothetical protein
MVARCHPRRGRNVCGVGRDESVSVTPDRPVYYRHKQFGNVILVDRIDRDFWLSGRDLASGHYVSAPRSMLIPLTPEEIRNLTIAPIRSR